MSKCIDISDSQFQDEVINSSTPVVLDFGHLGVVLVK